MNMKLLLRIKLLRRLPLLPRSPQLPPPLSRLLLLRPLPLPLSPQYNSISKTRLSPKSSASTRF